VAEGGVTPVDEDLRQQRCNEAPARQRIVKLLLDQVAHHTFALGIEHVERIGAVLRARSGLQGEQADLRAVAMRNDELMAGLEQRQEGSN
jgi:hypothetical protein